jgi:hypothetical protein
VLESSSCVAGEDHVVIGVSLSEIFVIPVVSVGVERVCVVGVAIGDGAVGTLL